MPCANAFLGPVPRQVSSARRTEALRVLSMKQSQHDGNGRPLQRAFEQAELDRRSPAYAEARNEGAMRQQVSELNIDFDRHNASAALRHSERTALLGVDAADRFAELDRQRAQWKSRVQAYVRERDALRARTGISADQRLTRAQALLSAFTPAERRRIAELDEAGPLR